MPDRVDQFNRKWAHLPKGKLVKEQRGNETWFLFALLVGTWRFIYALVLGPKGGVKEFAWGYDTREPYPAHALKFDGLEVDQSRTDVFVSLPVLRSRIRLVRLKHSTSRQEEYKAICSWHVQQLLRNIQDNTDTYVQRLDLLAEAASRSVQAVSGGLPSHGKRY